MVAETGEVHKVYLRSNQLASLLKLANVMPSSKLLILIALIQHLQQGTLKSVATREEIRASTDLSLSTIHRCIKEFISLGLISSWRGPFELKQCFYKIHLPVPDDVMDFYGQRKTEQIKKKFAHSRQSRSAPHMKEDQPSAIQGSDRTPKTDSTRHATETYGVAPETGTLSGMQRNEPLEDVGKEQATRQKSEEPPENDRCANPDSQEPHLDPEISDLLTELEKQTGNNTFARFLRHLGFVPPQVASDQTIQVDREKLLNFLQAQKANSVARLGELVQDFADSPSAEKCPAIDIPSKDSIIHYVHRKLECYPLGEQWLRKMVSMKDPDGGLLPEETIRRSLFAFMSRNELYSLDDVITLCVDKHYEAIEKPKPLSQLTENPLADLLPGELSCKAIVEKLVANDPLCSEDLNLSEAEVDLYMHCQAKFNREYAHLKESVTKMRQRKQVVNALVTVARSNPALVGYQPEGGEEIEPENHTCC
jgi:hypothetical protein